MKTLDNATPAIRGCDRLNRPKETMTPDRAEALLRTIMRYWIVELLLTEETPPDHTFDFVTDLEPELCKVVGLDRVRQLCYELHGAEDTSLSVWYSARFDLFNRDYYDGRLTDHRVRAVNDAGFWTKVRTAWNNHSHVDFENRQIVLGLTNCDTPQDMDVRLIREMAHVATGTASDADGDGNWLKELKRLKLAGAGVLCDECGRED